MTNLETSPPELVCDTAPTRGDVELLTPRDVPLGGPRAMTVRRTLPQRARSFIGAWCFADHYGPDDVGETGGMRVPPHPHTGLQTVSWLFSGEVEHRDSLGTHAFVRPGELNLMTAGRGIAHSEVSTPAARVLHGVQLWTLLPAHSRTTAPAFQHYAPPSVALASREAAREHDDASGGTPAPDGAPHLRVFLGSLAGSTSPVPTFSPLLGAELRLPSGTSVVLDLDPTFEHGVLVDSGPLDVDGTTTAPGELAYLPPGLRTVTLTAPADRPALLLVIGGEPLGERIVMWWNFIGTTHEEVAAARADWEAELAGAVVGGARDGATEPPEPRFGAVPGYDGDPLPAPTLPGSRLLPRG